MNEVNLLRVLGCVLAAALWLPACPEEEPARGPTPLVEPDAQAPDRQALREALEQLAAPLADAEPAVTALEALPAGLLAGGRAPEVASALERAVSAGRLTWARVEPLAARLGPAGVPLLALGLPSEDAEVRRRVSTRLAAAGGEGLRFLVVSLAEGDGADEARLGPARAALGRLCAADSVRGRLQAVELLPRLVPGPAGDEALTRLATLCADAVPEVRMAALEAVCALGPRAAGQVAPAVALLRDPDEGVRQVAAGALPRLGPPVVPAVAALLGEGDESLRALAVEVLGRVGEPAAEVLLGHRDASPRVRVAVLQALAPLPGPRALAALEAGLKDDEPRVRQETIRALAGREADPGTVALLGRALEEREPRILRSALESLDALGERASQAAPALLRLVREAPPELRLEALRVLTRVSASPLELSRHLGGLLGDPTAAVRRVALEQVALLGPGAVVRHRERVRQLAEKDPDLTVRQAALGALQVLGTAPDAAGAGFG